MKVMSPNEILLKWIEAFNNANVEGLTSLYADDAVNHQVANEPVIGREAIRQMFSTEFAAATMVCEAYNIF